MKKILLTLILCLVASVSYADVTKIRETLSENLNTAVRDLKESFSETQKELVGTKQTTSETKQVAKELYERSKEEELNPTVLTHGRKQVVNCDQKNEVLIWKNNTWQCDSAAIAKGCVPAADEYAYEDENGNMVCSKSEKGKGIDYYWKFRGHSFKCANVNEGRLKLYDCYYKNKQNVEIQVENVKCSGKAKPNAAKALCYGNWQAGNWGGCSKSCGGGTQTRSIWCPSGYDCSRSAKPTHLQACNTHVCTAAWTVSAWGSCQKTNCKTTGGFSKDNPSITTCSEAYQYRTVSCMPGFVCPGAKPATSQNCCNRVCVQRKTCDSNQVGGCAGYRPEEAVCIRWDCK